jgi:hypothetical protein
MGTIPNLHYAKKESAPQAGSAKVFRRRSQIRLRFRAPGVFSPGRGFALHPWMELCIRIWILQQKWRSQLEERLCIPGDVNLQGHHASCPINLQERFCRDLQSGNVRPAPCNIGFWNKRLHAAISYQSTRLPIRYGAPGRRDSLARLRPVP